MTSWNVACVTGPVPVEASFLPLTIGGQTCLFALHLHGDHVYLSHHGTGLRVSAEKLDQTLRPPQAVLDDAVRRNGGPAYFWRCVSRKAVLNAEETS